MNIKTDIDDVFFQEENRCGYLVTSSKKKLWAVQLDLLNELLIVCKKHDIKVIAFAGTILGAVRHHGYIPWDDDIDVALDRENYEKLLKIAPKEFQYPYFLQNGFNDKAFFLNYARLRNSDSTCIIKYNKSPDYNNGIYIDVFVLDGYVEDEGLYASFIKKKERLERLLQFYNYKSEYSSLKKIIKTFCHIFYKCFVNYDKLLERYNAYLQKYSLVSDKIGLLTHVESLREKYWIYRKEMDNIIYLDFEFLKVPVPADYDVILTRLYGDYMAFPPVEERGTWHGGVFEIDPDTPYKEYFKVKNGK